MVGNEEGNPDAQDRYNHAQSQARTILLNSIPLLAKIFDFSELPSNWTMAGFALDWDGRLVILAAEGKPARPDYFFDNDARSAYYAAEVMGHHVIWWDANGARRVQLRDATWPNVRHFQPHRSGWIIEVEGQATIFDSSGEPIRSFEIGDGTSVMGTTQGGNLWVGYIDEVAFCDDEIGRHGLICFDEFGQATFLYNEFAKWNKLPPIYDCYALNVESETSICLSHYSDSDFPFVTLTNRNTATIAPEFGGIGTFAIRRHAIADDIVYYFNEN